MIFISFYLDQSAILHIKLDAASAVTARSRRPHGSPNKLFLLLIFLHFILLSEKLLAK
jgi:hypothetical protein